jgi:hypothetical protein
METERVEEEEEMDRRSSVGVGLTPEMSSEKVDGKDEGGDR